MISRLSRAFEVNQESQIKGYQYGYDFGMIGPSEIHSILVVMLASFGPGESVDSMSLINDQAPVPEGATWLWHTMGTFDGTSSDFFRIFTNEQEIILYLTLKYG